MQRREWICLMGAGFVGLAAGAAFADEHGQGRGHDKDENEHGRGHGHDKHGERREFRYSDHDHQEIREWCRTHRGHLPPGLAKRVDLPPGLERQLEARGTLPPGLRSRMERCPEDLERRLPPPPPDCAHFIISGHIALVNRRTFAVLDVFRISL